MQRIEKPWGAEEILEVNDRYVVKRLTMHKGHQCSLQYHRKKHETVYVLSGLLRVFEGADAGHLAAETYGPGAFLVLPPNRVHRMAAVEDTVYLESSTPELDDVVRISDAYGRT